MNIKVAAACVLVAGGFAGWYALSAGTNRSGPAPSHVAAAAPIDASGVALSNEIARLGRSLQPVASPQRARDLFRFAAAPPRKTAAVPIVLPVPAEAALVHTRPALRLIGVAEDSAAGKPVRTAIISAPDQLYVVREGERVASRYGVARISPDVVELVDTGDSTELRLALK